MTVYNYEITYIDGKVDRIENLTEPMDLDIITQKPWWLLKCGQWSMLIRTELIARVREVVEELDKVASLTLALKRTGYSSSKTAEMLNISEPTLYRWMHNHGMRTEMLNP